MNQSFTRLLALTALSLASSFTATAADLVVGPGRTYQTITDAVAAAVDGDRILVMNRTAIYAETPTITKSLTIMSATEGVLIRCSGNWTFSPATAGKTLTVMNMNLLNGSITTAANAPAGARSQVRILGCVISGQISFGSYSNFDVTAAADSILSSVDITFGRVMGNYISGSCTVTTDATATNDSVWVVGNRIFYGMPCINLNTTSQYVFCANNYVTHSGTSDYYGNNQAKGILLTNSKTTGAGRNSIVNNTIINVSPNGYQTNAPAGYAYGIHLQYPDNNLSVCSNFIMVTSTTYNYSGYAISQTGGSQYFLAAYNIAKGVPNFSGAATNNLGNRGGSNTTLNSEGVPTAGSDVINGGMPEDEYLDTDLTRNDAGCYGGSYSLANFPRFGNTVANNQNLGGRVFFFAAPRTVQQGQSIKVRATGFDR